MPTNVSEASIPANGDNEPNALSIKMAGHQRANHKRRKQRTHRMRSRGR